MDKGLLILAAPVALMLLFALAGYLAIRIEDRAIDRRYGVGRYGGRGRPA